MEPLEKNSVRKEFLREILQLVLIVIVVLIPFRLYIAQPFVVDGSSMDPTFKDGQYLIVDELSYRFNDPTRGDVVVLRDVNSSDLGLFARAIKWIKKEPFEPVRYLIKRVIGLPGEEVIIKDGQVTIFNDEYPEGLVLEEPYIKFAKRDSSSIKLGDNEYFVMGDNRAASSDSRIWGPLAENDVIGRPIVRAIPLDFFPGVYKNYQDQE